MNRDVCLNHLRIVSTGGTTPKSKPSLSHGLSIVSRSITSVDIDAMLPPFSGDKSGNISNSGKDCCCSARDAPQSSYI